MGMAKTRHLHLSQLTSSAGS